MIATLVRQRPPRTLGTPLVPALALLLAAACGSGGDGGGGGPTGPGTQSDPVRTTSVALRNTAFTPPNIVVASRAAVQFTNEDAFAHNVTFDNGTIGTLATGTGSLTMPSAAGTYAFRCTIHPGMSGSVKVE